MGKFSFHFIQPLSSPSYKAPRECGTSFKDEYIPRGWSNLNLLHSYSSRSVAVQQLCSTDAALQGVRWNRAIFLPLALQCFVLAFHICHTDDGFSNRGSSKGKKDTIKCHGTTLVQQLSYFWIKILLLNQERVGYWEQTWIHCKKKKCRALCKHLSIISSQTSSWFAFQHRKHIFWPGMENTVWMEWEQHQQSTLYKAGRAWDMLQERRNSGGGACCQTARDQEVLPSCQALECVKLLKTFFDERRKRILPRRKDLSSKFWPSPSMFG